MENDELKLMREQADELREMVRDLATERMDIPWPPKPSGLIDRLRATAPQRAAAAARAAAERTAWRAAHPVPPEPPEPPAPRKRQRRLSLSRALREASKAGASVQRIDVDPVGGRISLIVGEEQSESSTDLDRWIAKHHAH